MAGRPKSRPITPRQLAFAQNIAVLGMDLTQAARSAGYSEFTAHVPGRLTKDPRVAQEIDRLRAQARTTMLMDAETWQRELLHQYATYRDSDGDLALAALDKWAKRLGLYADASDAQAGAAAAILARLFLQGVTDSARPQLSAPVVESVVEIDARADDKDAHARAREAEINGANGARGMGDRATP